MKIDIEKILSDLQPHIEEIAARVAALKPGEQTGADLTIPLPLDGGDGDYSNAAVPLAVHAAVFAAISKAIDVPVFSEGWRSTRYAEIVVVNYSFRTPHAPTAEDFAK